MKTTRKEIRVLIVIAFSIDGRRPDVIGQPNRER